MAHRHDWWERVREFVVPKLGVVAQFLEDITGEPFYAESETHNDQFVGRVAMNEEDFEKVLHYLDFDRNPLASWKHLESDPDNYEEGSFRKVGFDDAPDMQLHVVLYDGANMEEGESDYIYVYAHWEYRWDKHPLKHWYKEGFNGPKGVQEMKKLLDREAINYEPIRP